TLSQCFDSLPTNTAHQPPPPWPLALASPPRLRRGAHFQRSFSCPLRRPLDKGGLQVGFGAVTDNLVWIVDPQTHPSASVKASQAFTPSEGGDFQRSFS